MLIFSSYSRRFDQCFPFEFNNSKTIIFLFTIYQGKKVPLFCLFQGIEIERLSEETCNSVMPHYLLCFKDIFIYFPFISVGFCLHAYMWASCMACACGFGSPGAAVPAYCEEPDRVLRPETGPSVRSASAPSPSAVQLSSPLIISTLNIFFWASFKHIVSFYMFASPGWDPISLHPRAHPCLAAWPSSL